MLITGIYENVKLQHIPPYKPVCFANSDDGLIIIIIIIMMSDNETRCCNNQLLRPTQPPIQWKSGVLSLGAKQVGHETDHSAPSSAQIKNKWSYTPASTIHLHGMVRVTLTLPWTDPLDLKYMQQESQLCEFCLKLLVKENRNGWKVWTSIYSQWFFIDIFDFATFCQHQSSVPFCNLLSASVISSILQPSISISHQFHFATFCQHQSSVPFKFVLPLHTAV